MPFLYQEMCGRGLPVAVHMNTILLPRMYSDSKCDHLLICAPCEHTERVRNEDFTKADVTKSVFILYGIYRYIGLYFTGP